MLQDGQLGFQVQGVVPEGNNFSLYSGHPMGDDFTSFLVTTFLRSTLGERRVQASSSILSSVTLYRRNSTVQLLLRHNPRKR
jgi:hypothetical protein